jgi:hypothetical protein
MGTSRGRAAPAAPAQSQAGGTSQAELVIWEQTIERTNSWHSAFRKLRIRYEKQPQNYHGLVHFACVLIVYRLRLG